VVTLTDLRAHVERLLREHRITAEVRTAMPAGAAAYALVRERKIVVPPLESEEAFSVWLHEIAHVLAGDCCRGAGHYRDPAITDWYTCGQCEKDAWAQAITLAGRLWTPRMHRRLGASARHHLGSTRQFDEVKQDWRELARMLTCCQARLEASMRLTTNADRRAWLVETMRPPVDRIDTEIQQQRARFARMRAR